MCFSLAKGTGVVRTTALSPIVQVTSLFHNVLSFFWVDWLEDEVDVALPASKPEPMLARLSCDTHGASV